MRPADVLIFSGCALAGHRVRTGLTLLAIWIGVSSVLLLTAVGEGARRYVVREFESIGSNLVIVLPGRSETAGITPSTFVGETPRDLTLEDAKVISRLSGAARTAPVVVGEATVSHGSLSRESAIIGTTSEFIRIRRWEMATGGFLPPGPWDAPQPFCVIGDTVRKELFPGGEKGPGEHVKIGDRRFLVAGVLAGTGRSIGVDVDEVVIIPVSSALMLFDTNSLFRLLVEARDRDAMPHLSKDIQKTIAQRHGGEEDVTVITQDAVLSTFDRILTALTYTLGGIAAVSLVVSGILTMNVMFISVSQRTAEIGLLKALGASRTDIFFLVITEASLLAAAGSILGNATGILLTHVATIIFPTIPAAVPPWAFASATLVALSFALLFGLLPARRAADLDPVLALLKR